MESKHVRPQLASQKLRSAPGLTCCDPYELPARLLSVYDFTFEPGSKILFLPRSRVNAFKISADLARFIAQIPTEGELLANLILRFASQFDRDKQKLLAELYPDILRLINRGFIVVSDSLNTNDPPAEVSKEDAVLIPGWKVTREITNSQESRTYEIVSAEEVGFLKIFAIGNQRAGNEIQVLESFRTRDSVNFPEIIAHGQAEGGTYYITSWIQGQTLQSIIDLIRAGSDQFLLERRLQICNSMLAVYTQLHEMGLLHLDVHPGNILVTRELDVVLCDFEYSRPTTQPILAPFGIERFYSPRIAEYALDGEWTGIAPTEFDEQYSVAALIFETLTGWPAHATPAESRVLLAKICKGGAYSLEQRGLSSLANTSAVLKRATSLAPKDRFESMASFGKAFCFASTTDIKRLTINDEPCDSSEIQSLSCPSEAIIEDCADSFNLMNGAAGVFLASMIEARSNADISRISSIRAELEVAIRRCGGESSASLKDVYTGTGGLFVLAMKCDQILGATVQVPSIRSIYGEPSGQHLGLIDGPAGLAVALTPFYSADSRLAAVEYLLSVIDEAKGVDLRLDVAHGMLGTVFSLSRIIESVTSLDVLLAKKYQDILDQSWELIEAQILRLRNESDSLDWSWCSGLAGALRVMTSAAVKDDTARARASQIADAIRAHGPVRDGSLCCGNSGQALALWHYATLTADCDFFALARERVSHARVSSLNGHVFTSLYFGGLGAYTMAIVLNCHDSQAIADLCWLL